ncbi:MAG: XdhC family protein [Oscillospiraceae bacterium]|nr:XdhC family protein [Oscillospiraceae bacterium]
MRELLKQTIHRLSAGQRVIWCVVLFAQGSTPRGAGARMAVFEDGEALGTVGGGAVELQAIQFARSLPEGEKALVREYDLISGGSDATGMICGGVVRIGFFPLCPGNFGLTETLGRLAEALDRPQDRWLESVIRPDGSFTLNLRADTDLHSEDPRLPRTAVLLEEGRILRLLEPVSRNYMVYLFGGGHVGRALAPVLAGLGFPVTVYDPRPELARDERYPGAKVVLGDYENISQRITITRRDYAVVMTPEHNMDLTVLRQVLRSPATYIGCIGSKRKTAYVNQMLQEEGFSQADIARIHAPIGLPIKAKTPEEIAISIAAEMILHRAGG